MSEEQKKTLDSMNQQQIPPSGTIMRKSIKRDVFHGLDHEGNTKSRLKAFEDYHEASLSSGPLAVSLLGHT